MMAGAAWQAELQQGQRCPLAPAFAAAALRRAGRLAWLLCFDLGGPLLQGRQVGQQQVSLLELACPWPLAAGFLPPPLLAASEVLAR